MNGDAVGSAADTRRSQEANRAATGTTRVIPRPVVPPGPLGQLKDLLYEAYLSAGPPTLNEMAAAIAEVEADDDMVRAAPSRDTVLRLIKSPGLPPRQADAVSLAVVLTRMAGGDAEHAAKRAAQLWSDARLERPLGQPVGDLNPFDLEVHRSINATEGVLRLPAETALPAYVERPHDDVLRAAVRDAAAGVSRLVMLVSGSSTGKTRACWEAVRLLPDDWRLWHPIDPERPGAALAELPRVGPRTVIWLNESHHYLFTSEPLLGEKVAAGLREILRDPSRSPVLVLGTIWPEYRNQLMAEPLPGHPDPHAQARSLIAGHELAVPASFDEAAMTRLESMARTDARLAFARERAGEGKITQYLAGGPELLARYDSAPAGARAVVTAAMDARRAGHGLDMSYSFLARAAEGYFGDQEWDLLAEDWLEEAFAYAARPVRGARGLLTRRRPRRGEASEDGPVYRLADYLEQHGRETRRIEPIPASLWESALAHSASGTTLAPFARSCGLFKLAFHLEQQGSERAGSARRTGDDLRRAGRESEALTWYQEAGAGGDPISARMAGDLLWSRRNVDEALVWYRRAYEAGSQSAAHRAWYMLRAEGQLNREEAWMGSDEGASPELKELLAAVRRWKSEGRLRSDDSQPVKIAEGLLVQGRLDEALDWFQRAAAEGDPTALRRAAVAAMRRSDDEAVHWYQRAFEASDVSAAWRAGRIRRRQGRDLEAIEWYQRGAMAGDRTALQRVAYLMRDRGRLDEAVEWSKRACATGDEGAFFLTIQLLSLQGREEEAKKLRQFGWELDGSIAEPWSSFGGRA